METSTLLWIGGVAVVAVGAYLIFREKEDPKTEFLKRKSDFSSLIGKLSENKLSIEEWTEKVVSINDNSLTKWWTNIVRNNNRDVNQIVNALVACFTNWGVEIDRPVNPRLAKQAFVANVEKFASILNSLNNQTFDTKQWTEQIISVNDDNLTGLWKKYVKAGKTQEKWKQLLASWQIKSDTCKSFTCNTADNVACYQLPDRDSITMGAKYNVEEPCWVLTIEDADGKICKTVVSKGVVTPMENL